MAANIPHQPDTPKNPRSDSSMWFFKFMPYRAAMNAPEPMPSVPIDILSSRSIRELRLASRMALTL